LSTRIRLIVSGPVETCLWERQVLMLYSRGGRRPRAGCCQKSPDQARNQPAYESFAVQAALAWEAHEVWARLYSGEAGQRSYRHRTGRSGLVDVVRGADWVRQLAAMQNVQSWPSPGRPQEAGRSAVAIPLVYPVFHHSPRHHLHHPGSRGLAFLRPSPSAWSRTLFE
jgi:hypothetical protein